MAQGPVGPQGPEGHEGHVGMTGPEGREGPKGQIGFLPASLAMVLVGILAAGVAFIVGAGAGDDAQTLTTEQRIHLQLASPQWTGLPTSPMPVDQHPDYAKFTFDFQPLLSDYTKPVPMLAHHGPDCGGPPNNLDVPNNSPAHTHLVSTFPASIFVCNNHLMTSISAGSGYVEIGMIPNRILDFANGATIQWEQSTFLSTSGNREWLDVLITPFLDTVGYNDDRTNPSIGPRTGLQLRQQGGWHLNRWDNFVKTALSPCCWPPIDGVQGEPYIENGIVPGTNQSAIRQTMKLTISRTAAKLERLQSNTAGPITFFDVTYPALSFTQAIVKIGQHSYDPSKGCSEGANPCDPGTWHWDEMNLTPSIEFTAIKGNQRHVDLANPEVTFPQPAPANAYIRYISGFAHQISFNNGTTWVTPRVTSNALGNEFPHSIMQSIPAGTTKVLFKFPPTGCAPWPCVAHSFSIWAQSGGQVPTPIPTATVIRTRTPVITSTPVNTATPVPGVPTNTPVATSTAIPVPTGTIVVPGKCYADVNINPGPTGVVTGRGEKPC